MKKSTILLVYIFLFTVLLVPVINASSGIDAYYSVLQKQLGFQENKGQVMGADGNPTPYVLFLAEAPGLSIWVTTTGITYQFIEQKETEKHSGESREGLPEKQEIEWHRVDMILKNAIIDKKKIVVENDITQGRINFYTKHYEQGIFDVKTYSKITIKSIYNGIDWVLYSSEQGLKQDFIVHPYANAAQIKLIYEGRGRFEALNNRIHVETKIGELQEGKLFCYQDSENNEIESKYSVRKNEIPTNLAAGNFIKNQDNSTNVTEPGISNIDHLSSELFSYEVAVQLNNYDKSKNLIIDPQLVWATFYGGNRADGPMCVETDNNGNVFVAGYTGSATFPVVNPGGAYTAISGTGGAFISQFNNDGVLIWSTHYSFSMAPDDVIANAICIDPAGNVFLTGVTNSNLPLFNPGGSSYYQSSIGSSQDAFILMFATNGAALWGTYYGGDSLDVGTDIACDGSGNIYVTGFTKSTNFPHVNLIGAGYYQTANAGQEDAFIIKFTNYSTRQWSTYYGGSGKDISTSLDIEHMGDIVFTGYTKSSNFPTMPSVIPGSFFQAALAGTSDPFVLKFSSSGNRMWATYIGGTSSGVIVPFPIIGMSNFIIEEQGETVKADKLGNIFVSGLTNANNFPLVNAGTFFQNANGGGIFPFDNFILRFDAGNQLTWSTLFGGNGVEGLISFDNIEVDKCNNIYFSFITTSSNMITKVSCDAGFNDTTYAGVSDVFISKFNNNGVYLWGSYFGSANSDFREAIDVDDNGNLFITGEWTNPVNGGNNYLTTYPLIDPGNNAFYSNTYFGGGEDGYIAKFKPPTITVTITSTNSFCNCNGTASVNASGACSSYAYNWYDNVWKYLGNTQTISKLCPGTYIVVVRDTISCSYQDTAVVTIVANGTNTTVTDIQSICFGDSLMLPDSSFTSVGGTFYDTIPMHNGCDSMITTILSVNPLSYSAEGVTICYGETFTCPDGSVITQTSICYDTLTNIHGCDSIHKYNITVNPSPVANLSPNIFINVGQTVTLTGTGAGIFNWSPSAGLNTTSGSTVVASPLETTTYCLVVSSFNGCSDTGCVTIHVRIPCPENKELITLPNAFSPNADGMNDEFCIQGFYGCLVGFRIKIYERWGEKMYESSDPNFCWDGMYKGKLMEPQVFIYYIDAVYSNLDEPMRIKGNISLIR